MCPHYEMFLTFIDKPNDGISKMTGWLLLHLNKSVCIYNSIEMVSQQNNQVLVTHSHFINLFLNIY